LFSTISLLIDISRSVCAKLLDRVDRQRARVRAAAELEVADLGCRT
jgi:hypothetical protein